MVIYEPKGAAKEYCDLACNLYRGCQHGCLYCYAPSCTRKKREDFIAATPRADILRRVAKDAPKFSGEEVHLCFTCDPYTPIEAHELITRRTLEIFNEHQIVARVLTKGATLATRDFDLLAANGGFFGVTLTFDNPGDSARVEPNAAPPSARLAALRLAKAQGIPTWASFEPVIEPDQALRLIEQTLKEQSVDQYKVGKWNHAKEAARIDWQKFTNDAVALLERYGADYYIKNELKRYLCS